MSFENLEQDPAWIRGEKNLLWHLLNRSVQDLFIKEEKDAAISWFLDEQMTEATPFSFAWVCSYLDLDLTFARKKALSIIRNLQYVPEPIGNPRNSSTRLRIALADPTPTTFQCSEWIADVA